MTGVQTCALPIYESVHEPSEAYSSIQEMIKNKDVHFSNSYDERERVIEYLSRLKKMNQQQLEEEKKNVINELFDLGDDLNGNNLSYRDLQLALITGRDLDGIDIPNDTPEERQAEEHTEKMIKEDKYTRDRKSTRLNSSHPSSSRMPSSA